VLHYELSTTYRALNLWQESRESALRSLEIEPMQPNALSMIALADQNTGNGLGYLKNYIKAMEVDPKDHELPGWVAIFLYRLQLVEEAAEFRARVMTIAPSSPTAYRLNVMVAEVTGDLAAARTAARKAIEDDIADRMGAYSGAIDFLIRDGIAYGDIVDVMGYLETSILSLDDFEANVDFKYMLARFTALSGWRQTLPIEEVRRRAGVMYQYGVDSGFDIESDPGFRAYLLLLQGNFDAATEVILQEVFTEPLTTNLRWREELSHPMYDDIVADPRVQKELQRWEAEEEVLREEVRQYLASRD
jgi:tetratricopeptide (TPR) repeat protein